MEVDVLLDQDWVAKVVLEDLRGTIFTESFRMRILSDDISPSV